MNYPASLTDFFKSPKWMMNLLLGGVCCLIPFVGPMVIYGWLITGFWCRQDERFETFPDFDFNQFGKNLERGLWPVLAGFAVSIILVPLIMIGWLVIFFGVGAMAGHNNGGGVMGLVAILLVVGFIFVLSGVSSLVMIPLYLRAARLQDFMPAFNFAYIKRFATVMWKECLIAFAFMFGAGILLFIPALIPCIGTLLVMFCTSLLMFMQLHLGNQLYNLFVSRGGDPIPLSPKLTAGPPSPPATPLPPVGI